ncbi:MAG: family 10 glycosylhydrolase [Candidatus Obscuribacterales bacterium]|nr:family 10 glycosylhydrolase [Candidatus Obscuribacterales bacterium]
MRYAGSWKVITTKLARFLPAAIISLFSLATTPAWADSPLAVLNSERNHSAYSEQHIGDYDEDWSAFKRTFETANVRYDQLRDSDITSGSAKLSAYKVIVLPFLIDIPADAIHHLRDYVAAGGKLVITDGCGVPTGNAQEAIALCGAQVSGHSTMQEAKQFVWPRTPFALNQDFAVGTLVADLITHNPSGTIASWLDKQGKESGIAIAGKSGNAYIGWAPGLQGELSSNAQILSLILEEACPGITQQAAVQISFAEFQNIEQELAYLQKRTDEIIKTAKQADLAVSFKLIQENYDAAIAHVENFYKAYKERRFYEADAEVSAARHEYALAFAKAMPTRPVECRALWLDRGTIVACKNEQGLRELFDKLNSAHINIVYFETNNAGFTMYPSRYALQNPQIGTWDALSSAIQLAHERGMELHAWLWNFNVGNERHNPIIGKELEYPGPVLSNKKMSWALAGKQGSLFAHNQHEYWVDPANLEARQYCRNLCLEVVSRYPVDGLQYDYIRYPFNYKPNQMGWDWSGRLRFERETGLSLDNLDEETAQVWQAWRIAQVNAFVEETSNLLRKTRPGIRITAAVYGTPRRLRCGNIQQEWESWIQRGWIDAINPMTYVATAKDLQIAGNNCREASEDKALVFPGISIRQLDTAGFIEQLDTARAIGTLGTTFFAAAQLDDKKLELLRIGPYRKQALMTPQSDPIKAGQLLIDDFIATVNRYLHDPSKRVISDTASTNEVVKEIDAIQKEMHSLATQSSAQDINNVREHIAKLNHLVKDWLRIEAFAQRGFRAQYIISYLSQVESILTYAAHRSQTHFSSQTAALPTPEN